MIFVSKEGQKGIDLRVFVKNLSKRIFCRRRFIRGL